MTINLSECTVEVLKMGEIDFNRNVDLVVFSHPLYFEYTEGDLFYDAYKEAFCCFELNNN